MMFAEPAEKAGQGEMRLDLTGITDEQFWERAEQRIYDALEAYAGQAENGGGFQRRLFADDAAQGFAFIDLCRKRYDVVVMNPPFGAGSELVERYIAATYPKWASTNLICGFLFLHLRRTTYHWRILFLRRGPYSSSEKQLRKPAAIYCSISCPSSVLLIVDGVCWTQMSR